MSLMFPHQKKLKDILAPLKNQSKAQIELVSEILKKLSSFTSAEVEELKVELKDKFIKLQELQLNEVLSLYKKNDK